MGLCKSLGMQQSFNKDAKEDEVTVESKGYVLMPSKYIKFIDHDLDIDYATEIVRIQGEMKEVMKQEKQSQKMLEDAFKGIGYGID